MDMFLLDWFISFIGCIIHSTQPVAGMHLSMYINTSYSPGHRIPLVLVIEYP